MNGTLDPQAVNLTRAIRQTESGGNFQAKGKSGEYGAYQYTPDTWSKDSSKYGVNVPLEKATKQQQNEVAYKKVKELKDAGYNVGQIASIWNSGNPEWEGNVGVNKHGVAFDTPKYVNSVSKAYQTIKGGGNVGIDQNNPSSVDASQNGSNFVNPGTPPPQGNNFVTPSNETAQTPAVDTSTNGNPKKGGFWNGVGKFINSIESPFIGLAATPVQALAKLAGKQDPYAQGVPGVGSNVDVTPLNLEKKLGDAAQVGSYLVPGEGVLGAAGMGLLQGAGSQMSQGADLAQTAIGGGEGALLGGATAGLTKLAGAGLSKAGELLSGESAQKAVQGIKDAYSSALNLNASERAFENRSGKDLAEVLVKNGASLGRYENGTLDASKAIETIQNKLTPLNAEADKILSHSQGVVADVSLPEIEANLHATVDAMKIPEVEKVSAKNEITDYLKAEAKKYGTDIPPDVADRIKQGFWGATFDRNRTNLQNHIPYIIGKELQGAAEKAIAGTDTETSLHLLNKERSNLIDALRRLQKMDGVKLLKGGRLGNMAGGLTGTIIGSSMGPLGGLAGDYFGTKAAEFLNNPETRLAIAKGKASATGLVPRLLGKSAKPAGEAVSTLGKGVHKLARPAGLITNLLTK